VDSYLKQIEEKKERIKELEEKLKELDIDKDKMLEQLETTRIKSIYLNSDVLDLFSKVTNIEFVQNNLKIEKKASVFLAIFLFGLGTIGTLLFNLPYLGIIIPLCAIIGVAIGGITYLFSTKDDRKYLKECNYESLKLELAEKKEQEKELEREIKNTKEKIEEFLKESGYYGIEEEISKLNNGIEELNIIRTAAIDELLDDLLEQQELADKLQNNSVEFPIPFYTRVKHL